MLRNLIGLFLLLAGLGILAAFTIRRQDVRSAIDNLKQPLYEKQAQELIDLAQQARDASQEDKEFAYLRQAVDMRTTLYAIDHAYPRYAELLEKRTKDNDPGGWQTRRIIHLRQNFLRSHPQRDDVRMQLIQIEMDRQEDRFDVEDNLNYLLGKLGDGQDRQTRSKRARLELLMAANWERCGRPIEAAAWREKARASLPEDDPTKVLP